MTEAILCGASVGINLVLLSACLFLFWRQRKFLRPYDPKVCVYVNSRKRSGWVTALSCDPDRICATGHSNDAAVYRLSEIKADINLLIRHGLYVRVCRIVHPEHWKENKNER